MLVGNSILSLSLSLSLSLCQTIICSIEASGFLFDDHEASRRNGHLEFINYSYEIEKKPPAEGFICESNDLWVFEFGI